MNCIPISKVFTRVLLSYSMLPGFPTCALKCNYVYFFYIMRHERLFFKAELLTSNFLALMQNHGLVHYFTLDFIPCVLSWTMDSGPLLYTSFFFSTLKNLMQNHGPTRTKKSCPIEQDIVLTGSMIVHEISMQQCTSEESWTHK